MHHILLLFEANCLAKKNFPKEGSSLGSMQMVANEIVISFAEQNSNEYRQHIGQGTDKAAFVGIPAIGSRQAK
jgi:hypothetical protein